jgi:hypothetical protein
VPVSSDLRFTSLERHCASKRDRKSVREEEPVEDPKIPALFAQRFGWVRVNSAKQPCRCAAFYPSLPTCTRTFFVVLDLLCFPATCRTSIDFPRPPAPQCLPAAEAHSYFPRPTRTAVCCFAEGL